MDALDHALRIASAWTAEQQPRRAAVADALAAIVAAYNEAIQVWQDFGETELRPANANTIADWLGARRVERLRACESRVNHNFDFIERETGVPGAWGFPHDHIGFMVAERTLHDTGDGEAAARDAAEMLAARLVQVQRAVSALGMS